MHPRRRCGLYGVEEPLRKDTMLKNFAVGALIGAFALTGCSKSAEDEAADLVKELKDAGISIEDDTEECLTKYLKTLSGDDIKSLKEDKASDELTAEFGTKLLECGVGA
jgi:hypothetical protein